MLASAAFIVSLFALAGAPAPTGTEIVIGGQRFDVGRPVVLWDDAERGFNGYAEECLESRAKASSPCCQRTYRRFGVRPGVRTLEDLQKTIRQLVLHHDGCVNSRSCFYSMHDMPRADGTCGSGLSAHFMIDADGTIYQTLDVRERAFHAEESNAISIGVEICNRADASRNELHKLPADYRSRPVRDVVINGRKMKAFDFRPEQYRSAIALARTIIRVLPQVKPVMPERNGEPLLETLAKPQEFSGIVGHLHVDRQGHKWDPGAFDWKRFLSALTGYYLPHAVAGHTRFPADDPATTTRMLSATFAAAEERATGFFPLDPGALLRSGLNLRGVAGNPIVAPARGTILAARMARRGRSSTSFLLMRHEAQLGRDTIRFFSLLAHVSPVDNPETSELPWLQHLVRSRDRRALSTLRLGETALLEVPVEAGELVGHVGYVKRGAEIGAETRFEIFTIAPPPAELRRFVRVLDATADGPWMRRPGVLDLLASAGARPLSHAALAELWRSDHLDVRQAMRGLVLLHSHEWGSRNTEAAFVGAPELASIPEADRRRIYGEAFRPYIFWTDAVSKHAALPEDQVVHSYNPIAFLGILAAGQGRRRLRWPAADIPYAEGAAAAQPPEALSVWTTPPPEPPPEPPLFGRFVPVTASPRRVRDMEIYDDLPALGNH